MNTKPPTLEHDAFGRDIDSLVTIEETAREREAAEEGRNVARALLLADLPSEEETRRLQEAVAMLSRRGAYPRGVLGREVGDSLFARLSIRGGRLVDRRIPDEVLAGIVGVLGLSALLAIAPLVDLATRIEFAGEAVVSVCLLMFLAPMVNSLLARPVGARPGDGELLGRAVESGLNRLEKDAARSRKLTAEALNPGYRRALARIEAGDRRPPPGETLTEAG